MIGFCWRRTSSYACDCLTLSVANVVIGKIKKLPSFDSKEKTPLPILRLFYQVSAWFERQLNSKELCIKTQFIVRVVEGKIVSEKFALENSNKGMVTAILPIVT